MMALLTLLSMIAAVVPIVGFLGVVWWLDRYDREPWGLFVATFLWGAIGGIGFALIGSALFMQPIQYFFDPVVAESIGAVVVAPLVEEPTKAVVLFVVALSRHFDNTTDGFVYGAATGLGFGMTENFLYFVGAAATGDVTAWLGTVVLRTLYSALMHACASASIGAALGAAKFRGCLAWGALVPTGFAVAIGIHALWNGLMIAEGLLDAGGALAIVNLLVFPLEAGFLLLVFELCLWDEKSTIRRELQEEVAAGVLPEAHVPVLASYLKRNRRSWLPPGVDHHAYVRAATTLAFRKRQARSARGAEHAAQLPALRREIRGLLEGHVQPA